MSNFHSDLSMKLSQREVHDFSGEVQKFSGEVQNDLRGGVHLPGHTSPQDLAITVAHIRHGKTFIIRTKH
jgi:hypothetical protein